MKIKVKVYDQCKYNKESKKVAEVEYNDVKKASVENISDAEIFGMGFDDVDEFGEYFIMVFENGETATFRNSHIDAFRI